MRHETYCVFDILDVQIKVNIFFFKLANNTPTPKKKKTGPSQCSRHGYCLGSRCSFPYNEGKYWSESVKFQKGQQSTIKAVHMASYKL